MPQWHSDLQKRKRSGGGRKENRGKRGFERGSPPSETIIGDRKMKKLRGRGGNVKNKILSHNEVNVIDTASGKAEKAEIKKVVENTANREFQKRGIITKGAIIDTSLGRAQVTSRPGQSGGLHAILLQRTSKS